MDYSKLLKKDLIKICEKNSLKYYKSWNKTKLIELINDNLVNVNSNGLDIVENENSNNFVESDENNNYVLDHCDVLDFMSDDNLNTLKECVKTYINGRREFYEELNMNLKIESEFSEWWMAKSMNGVIIGSGNCPMDVQCNGKYIDVACLCLNSNFTNEKSIIQNFKSAGNKLDDLFASEEDEKIVEIFNNILYEKWELFPSSYYGFFISNKSNVFLSIFKINNENIKNLSSGGFSSKGRSVRIEQFINPSFGKVIIYKSKKRMEIRLSKKIIEKSTLLI